MAFLGLHAAPAAPSLCLAGAVDGDAAGRLRAAWVSGTLSRAMLDWALMTLAMMTPLALPLLRHVAARSFVFRRHRAGALFLIGALTPWLLAGLFALPVMAAAPTPVARAPWIAACAFLLAAAWQLTRGKRSALRRCHLTLPLAPYGRRADLDCVRQGLAHARACMSSCWALMLAMTLTPYHPVVAICVQCIALAERRTCRPPLVQIGVALACGAAALSAAAVL
jgi:predicted metal-binding membrane protein